MFKPNYLKPATSLFVVILLVSILVSNTSAQDASNKRGFQPGNSFSNGDFETINTTNGNLLLKFPMAALPPGRNGLTAGINLYYSSKLFDSEVKYFLKENQSCEVVGEEPGIIVCPYYKKTVLKESEEGGWQFGTNYSLRLIDRHDEFVNIPLEQRPQCWNPNVYSESPGYYEMRYHYKLILIMPDGTTHEMRPNGWSDGNFNDPQSDYFDIRPDGYWNNCQTVQWYANTITYYSIDGSFLRLDIQHDGNTAGGPYDNPWILYFPDGSKVTTNQPNSEPQRFYDRNNNYIEFVGNQIRDQFNRSISISNTWDQNGLPIHTITSQGFGQTLSWTVHWKWISVLKNYWPCAESLGCDPEVQQQEPYGGGRVVVDTITLPAQAGGLTYTFTYNAQNYIPGQPLTASDGWGEINGITLPSGAHIDYQFEQDGAQPFSATPDILRNSPTSKVLTYLQEYDGTSVPVTETWTYAITSTGSTVTAPDQGTRVTEFFDTSRAFWNSGLTYRTVGPDGTKQETIWERNNLANNVSSNPYPKTVFTSIQSGGTYVKTAIQDYKYDKNGNVTRVVEYDWVNYENVPRDAQGWPTGIPTVSPSRTTVHTYLKPTPDSTQFAGNNANVYWSSGSPRVKNAVLSSEVHQILPSGAEAPVTRVEYTYATAADPLTDPANLTELRTWDSTKGGYSNPLTNANSVVAATVFNQYGMPTLVTDPRGLKTQFTYGVIGAQSDLYATQVKSAYGTAQERTETRDYDFGTGLVTRITDVDNASSTATSYDAFGRPVLVSVAEGKPEETQTATEYDDNARRVITKSDLTEAGDGKLVSIQHFDQLGRVRLSRDLEEPTEDPADEAKGIKVQTRYSYSGMNSFVLISNSFRAATSGAAGSEHTMGWTRTKRDKAGRVIEVQTFSGPNLPAPWGANALSTGSVTTNYDANFTTVSDQRQKQRRSVADGFGRMIRVDEPDAIGNLGSTSAPVQPTFYSYDVLGNLTHVTQSDGTTIQNRDFAYSSLSRLILATNPESGSISYKYDDSGNLVVKTDARTDPNDSNKHVSVHYEYDALNRITRRWYNGSNLITDTTHNSPSLPAGVGLTEEVKFFYDHPVQNVGAPTYTLGFAKGRLVAETYGSGTNGDYYAYDALGRATLKYQRTGSTNYRMSINYNKAGAVTSLTYPSDHTIVNFPDSAGRLFEFSGNLGVGGTQRTYSTGLLYSPEGALAKEQFGTDTAIYNKQFYNSRGQLAEIRTSTTYTSSTDYSADRGAIVSNYSSQCSGICSGSAMTDNDGDLRRQTIEIPNQSVRWQEFEYDSLNRLSWAREVVGANDEKWKQDFDYDRWGNRTIKSSTTGGVNEKPFAINHANNRLGVPSGQSGLMAYDAVGNLTMDTYTGTGERVYDAENRIVRAWGGDNQAQYYGYDGSGRRISRIVNGLEMRQVYGFYGELLAEYSGEWTATTPKKEYGYRNGQLLISADSGNAFARPEFADDFNDNSFNATYWTKYYPGVPAVSEQAQQLQVTLPANTAAYNGVYSNARYNLTGKMVQLELPQAVSQAGWCENYLEVESDANNYFLIQVGVGNIMFRARVNGVNDQTTIPFDVIAHRFWRIRHDQTANVIYFETSANDTVWTSRKTVTPGFSLNSLQIDLLAGCYGTGNSNPGTVKYDNVKLLASTAGATSLTVANASFEAPVVGNGSFQYSPAGGAWSFANGGGISGMNSGFTGSPSSAPDGLQIAFIQATGEISQSISGFQANTNYVITFSAAQRSNCCNTGGQDIEVYLDSELKGTFHPSSGSYAEYSTANFNTTAGSHVVKFVGLNPLGGDHTAFIDNVRINGSPKSGYGIQWLVSDQLGTPRMVFDQSGALGTVKRHDYMPFGEELFANQHGREESQGYASGDGIRQQFTANERDLETSMDYFAFRYYQSIQGRFSSPDPLISSGKPTAPQSWNRYNYCANNPKNVVDPYGLDWWYERDSTRPSPIWFDRDPGTTYKRWTDTYDYVYYDNSANKYAVLDPNANRAFITNSLDRANELFDTYFSNGGGGMASRAEVEFISGIGAGVNPVGMINDAINEARGLDTTSRDYLLGRVIGMGIGGGLTAAGTVFAAGKITTLGTINTGRQPAWITPGALAAEEEQAALKTIEHIENKTVPVGPLAKKWGTTFRNGRGDLPGTAGAGGYSEYRVVPGPGVSGAGTRRLVVNDLDGSMYYTWTHYGDKGLPAFVRIR